MKTIKILTLAMLAFAFSGEVNAQSASTSSRTEVKKEAGPDMKKVRTLFESGEIPADFPKYDESLTKEEFKVQVKTWASISENYALFSAKGKEKFASNK